MRRMSREQTEEMQGLIEHLDEWMSKGGFMPTAWMKGRNEAKEVSVRNSETGNFGVSEVKTICSNELMKGGMWPRIKN